jgi:hypothetical protein
MDRDRLLSPSRGGSGTAGGRGGGGDDATLLPPSSSAAGLSPPAKDIWDCWQALAPYVQYKINGVDTVKDLVAKMADGCWLVQVAEMVLEFDTGRVSLHSFPLGSDDASCEKRLAQ